VPVTTVPVTTGTWSNVSIGTDRGATITIAASVYPNAAGVTFFRNGVLNRTDATGPQNGSVFEVWPKITIAAGDVLRATWKDKASVARESIYTVPGGTPATTAPATTAPATTAPAPTVPATTAPPPATQPSSSAAFVETFTGNTGLQRFRMGVFHRDADAHGFGLGAPGERTWPADHDLNCGPPDTKRILDKTDRSGSFYMCRDHMMTSMGHVDGYSVVWFSPNQSFAHINRVCWDVNVSSNLLGHRQWWEVGILPVGQPDVFAIDWLAGTANLPNYGDVNAVVLGFGPDNGPYPKLSVGNNVVGGGSINDADRNDIAKRVPHCLRDNGNGTITYSNDTPSGGFTAPGSFPAGTLKVVFKDHNYTPDKDCGHMPGGVCQSYTWHWDNIIIE
jgi:hypothetical protein